MGEELNYMPALSSYGLKAPKGGYSFGIPNAQFENVALPDFTQDYTPKFDIMSPSTWTGKGFNTALQDWGVTGGKDTKTGNTFNGWGGLALGLGQGISNFYMGSQALDLQRQQLAQGQKEFNLNFGAQAGMANSRLEAQNNRRIAEGMVPTMSTADYMAKYGVKTA